MAGRAAGRLVRAHRAGRSRWCTATRSTRWATRCSGWPSAGRPRSSPSWGARSGAPVVDVVMPNIFGEHGVPHYNSVVATFSHLIARGETPTLVDDKELPLVHVQRVADVLLDQALAPTSGSLPVEGTPAAGQRRRWRGCRRSRPTTAPGVLPDLADPFTRDLFNTYRAATFPEQWPIHPPVNSDAARRAGRDGQGRRRADAGVLLLHQPGLHPRSALAPPQGGAVPGAARAGRDPAAQAVHRRGGHVPGQRRAAGDHRHAHDVGPLDHQHRPRRADHPVLRRRDLRPRTTRHLSPRRSES